MRQRSQQITDAPASIAQRLIYLVNARRGAPVDDITLESSSGHIAEPNLVALAAMHHLNPALIEDKSKWEVFNKPVRAVDGTQSDELSLFDAARQKHRKEFDHWVTDAERETFLRMLASVRVN